MDAALRALLAVGLALTVVWTSLVLALVFLRPERGLLREAIRILPDTLRLLRRLSADRDVPRGVVKRAGMEALTRNWPGTADGLATIMRLFSVADGGTRPSASRSASARRGRRR